MLLISQGRSVVTGKNCTICLELLFFPIQTSQLVNNIWIILPFGSSISASIPESKPKSSSPGSENNAGLEYAVRSAEEKMMNSYRIALGTFSWTMGCSNKIAVTSRATCSCPLQNVFIFIFILIMRQPKNKVSLSSNANFISTACCILCIKLFHFPLLQIYVMNAKKIKNGN